MPIFFKYFYIPLLLVTCLLCHSAIKGKKKKTKTQHLRQHRGHGGIPKIDYSRHWHTQSQPIIQDTIQRPIVTNQYHVKYLQWGPSVMMKRKTEYYNDLHGEEEDDDGGGGGDNGDDLTFMDEKDENGIVASNTQLENENDNVDKDGDDDADDEGEEDDDDDEVTDWPRTDSPTVGRQSNAPTLSPGKKNSKQKTKQQEQQSNMNLSNTSAGNGQINTAAPSETFLPSPTIPPKNSATATATTIPTLMDKSNMYSMTPTASPTILKKTMTHTPTVMPTLVETAMTNAPTVSSTPLKIVVSNAPTTSPSAHTHLPTNNNSHEQQNNESSNPINVMDDDYYSDNSEPTPSSQSMQIKSNTAKEDDDDDDSDGDSHSEDAIIRSESSSKGDDHMMDKIYEVLTPEEIEYLNRHKFLDEEKEAAKISFVYFIVTIFLMIFTAHQLSENPDGVYSNMCRLAITVSGCVLKIFLLPFRKICGVGTRQGYSHHLVSNDPYSGESIISSSSRMEMI